VDSRAATIETKVGDSRSINHCLSDQSNWHSEKKKKGHLIDPEACGEPFPLAVPIKAHHKSPHLDQNLLEFSSEINLKQEGKLIQHETFQHPQLSQYWSERMNSSAKPFGVPPGAHGGHHLGTGISEGFGHASRANLGADNVETPSPMSVWGLSLPGTAVKSDDFAQALSFILQCKDNDYAESENFLRGALRLLRQRMNLDDEEHSTSDEVATSKEFDAFISDDTDDKQTTLVLLVPGQSHIIGHLIGKSGSEITKLESAANVSIRVESKSKMPVGSSERRIFIVGSVANSVFTQQRITQRIHEKLREEGVKQELIKIVIPHESVPHLIGKGGSSIKRLQELSHARIQVEQETSVVPGTIGRSVTIQGSQYERSMAQYLISRQMTENRSTPKEWQGGLPQPQTQHLNGPFPLNLLLEDPVPGVPPVPGLAPSSAPPGAPSGPANAKANFFNSQGMTQSSAAGGLGPGGESDSVESQGYVDPDKGWFNGKPDDAGPQWQAGDDQQGQHLLQPPSQQQPSPPFINDSGNAAINGGLENANGGDAYINTTQQYERLVPNGAVAHLIGRNGSVISDIQKKSGTRISFSKNPGPRAAEVGMGMGHYQKVTIIGTPFAIQLAQSMISKKIIEHVGEDFERL